MRKRKKNGLPTVSFGLGLIVAIVCPQSWLIVILALAVVVLGVSSLKC